MYKTKEIKSSKKSSPLQAQKMKSESKLDLVKQEEKFINLASQIAGRKREPERVLKNKLEVHKKIINSLRQELRMKEQELKRIHPKPLKQSTLVTEKRAKKGVPQKLVP